MTITCPCCGSPDMAVPDWQFVPKKLTPEMITAAAEEISEDDDWTPAMKKAWVAMLAAAPKPGDAK